MGRQSKKTIKRSVSRPMTMIQSLRKFVRGKNPLYSDFQIDEEIRNSLHLSPYTFKYLSETKSKIKIDKPFNYNYIVKALKTCYNNANNGFKNPASKIKKAADTVISGGQEQPKFIKALTALYYDNCSDKVIRENIRWFFFNHLFASIKDEEEYKNITKEVINQTTYNKLLEEDYDAKVFFKNGLTQVATIYSTLGIADQLIYTSSIISTSDILLFDDIMYPKEIETELDVKKFRILCTILGYVFGINSTFFTSQSSSPTLFDDVHGRTFMLENVKMRSLRLILEDPSKIIKDNNDNFIIKLLSADVNDDLTELISIIADTYEVNKTFIMGRYVRIRKTDEHIMDVNEIRSWINEYPKISYVID